MTPDVASAIAAYTDAVEQRQRHDSCVLVARARLDGSLKGLCELVGFATVAADVQRAVQRLAEQERAAGRLPSGWVA